MSIYAIIQHSITIISDEMLAHWLAAESRYLLLQPCVTTFIVTMTTPMNLASSSRPTCQC